MLSNEGNSFLKLLAEYLLGFLSFCWGLGKPNKYINIMSNSNSHFKADFSGIFHFNTSEPGTVFMAIEEALKSLPGPSFFWFNGTFCPIVLGDTVDILYDRWQDWRDAYQSDAKLLLKKMEEFCLQ